jgi:CBS domain-containing protein
MKVEDLMTRNVSVCGAEDSLNRAAQLMWECDCGSVPVVDASGCVCGMITDRDLCMAAYTQGLSLHEIQVRSAMSPKLYACSPGDPIAEAEALMQRNKVRRAPVVDSTGLVGILSIGDLLIQDLQSRREPGLRPEALVQTLATISSPNGHAGPVQRVSLDRLSFDGELDG